MIALRCRRGSPHQGATRRLPEDRTFFKSATALRFKLTASRHVTSQPVPTFFRVDYAIPRREMGDGGCPRLAAMIPSS